MENETMLEKVLRKIIREEGYVTRDEDALLTPKEAAKYLRLTVDTLAGYRSKGIGPAYVQGQGGNGKVNYRLAALKDYARVREVKTRDSVKMEATR